MPSSGREPRKIVQFCYLVKFDQKSALFLNVDPVSQKTKNMKEKQIS